MTAYDQIGRTGESLEEKNDARYRALFNRVPVGLYRTTVEGQIVDANPALVEMLRYPDRETLLQTNVCEGYVNADDREGWQELIADQGMVQGYESRWRRHDGEIIWVSEDARCIRDAKGSPAYYEGTIRDITELKTHVRELETVSRVSQALRTAQSRAELISGIVAQVHKLTGAQAVAILSCRSDTDDAHVESAQGLWRDEDLPLSAPLVKRILKSCQERTYTDISESVLGGGRGALESVVGVPLRSHGRSIGALMVGYDGPTYNDELKVLSSIGDIAANAIRRATNHEETQNLYRQLQNARRFTRRIMESIPSSLIVFDRNLRVVSANRNFLVKSKQKAESIIGKHIRNAFPSPLLEYTHWPKKIRRIFKGNEGAQSEKITYRAPGLGPRVYFYRLIPIEKGGRIDSVMLLMDDITRQEQLSEEVRQAERHLASLVECASDIVISMDPEGKILTWNPAAEEISGISSQEIEGRSILSLPSPEHKPRMREMLHVLRGSKDVFNAEADIMSAQEEMVPVSWNCSALEDEGGEVIGFVAVGRDLRGRREMEAQLINSAKMASLGVMAGGIAHEIRNPLGVVIAAVQLLQEHRDDKGLANECIEKITQATERASSVVENLLKFARPQEGKIVQFDVEKVMEEALDLLRHEMALRKVTLEKSFQPHLSPLNGNPELLRQVFTNMIINACNAMPSGGMLTITIRESKEQELEIRFADTGHGIPQKNLSKIFDPFFTTMPVGKGTGLGLAISYSIVQQHDGSIEVQSERGEGTTFTIYLPIRHQV